ncbi:MAG: magnesium transporter [Candidatus Nanoarchaeia archaeon]
MKIIKKILKESLLILIAASIVSTIGGFGLEALKNKLTILLPLIILVPALNDMIGDFGTIISAKFTTLLFLGKIRKDWWNSKEVIEIFTVVASIALLMAFYLGIITSIVGIIQHTPLTLIDVLKIIAIAFMLVASLVLIIFFTSVFLGLKCYKKGKDPNNLLIPLSTALADAFSLALFTALIIILF